MVGAPPPKRHPPRARGAAWVFWLGVLCLALPAAAGESAPADATPPSASPAAVEQAKVAEERAFSLIENERWCEAMGAFVEANALAPNFDLIYNAAQAADLAGDRRTAVKLYAELLGAYPDSEKQDEVNARVVELTQEITEKGPGPTCEMPDLASTSTAADAPPDEKVDDDAPAESEADRADADGASRVLGVLPWTVAGAGAVTAALGTASFVAAVVPFFGHGAVRQQILDAEAAGTDASALHAQQAAYRGAWDTWGEPVMWLGIGVSALGTAALGAGLMWGATTFLMADGNEPGDDGDVGVDAAAEGAIE